MKVWVVELGEPLPFQPDQRLMRYGELTKVLASRGHEVTWWASDFSHQSKSFIGAANARVAHRGVTHVLVHGPGYRRNAGLSRLRHVIAHARNLRRLISLECPPDVIVAGMPTIEASKVATDYGRAHGVPVIVDIRDEWPEDYVRWLPKLLRPLGRLALRRKFLELAQVCSSATALCGVTRRQLEYGFRYAGRVAAENDRVFYTGAHLAAPDEAAVALRVREWRSRGLGVDDFVCVFVGSMSQARPLDSLIAATKRLGSQLDLKLVLAGGGDLEAHYRALADGHPRILFAGWVGSADLLALQQVADILVAPYSASYGFSMPTKIFDYLAAGRPLLSSCPGEAEQLLESERVGVQFQVDNVDSIISALETLHGQPAGRREMGVRARQLFEREFALENIAERYANHLEHIAARGVEGLA